MVIPLSPCPWEAGTSGQPCQPLVALQVRLLKLLEAMQQEEFAAA